MSNKLRILSEELPMHAARVASDARLSVALTD